MAAAVIAVGLLAGGSTAYAKSFGEKSAAADNQFNSCLAITASPLATVTGLTADAESGASTASLTTSVAVETSHITDYFNIGTVTNNCDKPLTVHLDAGATSGSFTGLIHRFYVSKIAAPTTDFANTTSWNQTPVMLTGTVVTTASSGTQTVAAGSSMKLGIRVESGTGTVDGSLATSTIAVIAVL